MACSNLAHGVFNTFLVQKWLSRPDFISKFMQSVALRTVVPGKFTEFSPTFSTRTTFHIRFLQQHTHTHAVQQYTKTHPHTHQQPAVNTILHTAALSPDNFRGRCSQPRTQFLPEARKWQTRITMTVNALYTTPVRYKRFKIRMFMDDCFRSAPDIGPTSRWHPSEMPRSASASVKTSQ
jgi:hypothetical protein